MPFAIMLMPADVERPAPAYRAAFDAAIQANGGSVGPGGVVRLPDGGEFAVKSNDVWAKRLTPGVCRVVFDAAFRTNTYLATEGAVSTPLKVKGSSVEAPPELGPSIVLSDPAALCVALGDRLAQWNRVAQRMRDKGEIGADDQPLGPNPDPGTESRLASDPSGVAVKCEASSRQMLGGLGWKFVRAVVTRNANWGVVWRADIAPDPDPSTWMRESCWRAHDGTHMAASTFPPGLCECSTNPNPSSRCRRIEAPGEADETRSVSDP